MNIFYSLKSFVRQNNNSTIITIGSFDGIHLGHASLFKQMVELGEKNNLDTLVLSFSSHPKKILSPEAPIHKLLNDSQEKITYISNYGIKNLLIIPFTLDLVNVSATHFLSSILIQQLKAKFISVGYNHAFGKGREGNVEWLKKKSKKYKFNIHEVQEKTYNGHRVSSTLIRNFIRNAKIELANKLLGYIYSISGEVVRGQGIGRNIGFPTANILPHNSEKLIPKNGVYAVIIEIERRTYQGVANIGYKPTIKKIEPTSIQQKEPQIEVHILYDLPSLYKKKIVVSFHYYLREEKLFKNIQMLQTHIQKDIVKAKKYLRNYE